MIEDARAALDEAARDAVARVVLETMPTAFIQLDHEWRFHYVNVQAERLLGAERGDLLGAVLWERFPAAAGGEFETRYRQAVDTETPVSFEAWFPEPVEAWYEVRAWPTLDGLSVYFLDVTDRHEAQRTLERDARRGSLMARVGHELTHSFEVDHVVGRLADLLVPELGDWCVATLLTHHGVDALRPALRDVGWAHRDPELRPLLDRFAEIRLSQLSDLSFMPTILDSSAPLIANGGAIPALESVCRPGEALDLARRLDPSSVAVVRLPGRSRDVGLLTMFRGPDRPGFSDEDVDLLTEVAARAGVVLDNARLFAEQRDLAEGLQRSMLSDPPKTDDLEIVVRYEPAAQAAQVGGDWYDAFVQPNGTTVVVVGDVVGHDVAAAAAMGQVRALLRGVAVHSGEGPAGVLRGVDQVMDVLQVDTTATAVVARLEQTADERAAGTTRIRWSSAGHPPAVVVTPDGDVRFLGDLDSDLLLGLDPATDRSEREHCVPRGSTLLLYTDGLVERRGEPLDVGLRRLESALRGLVGRGACLEEVCDELVGTLASRRREDDVALVAVRLQPQS